MREMGREREATKVAYTVEQLVAFNRYNPDILPDLENYVNDQVSYPSISFFFHFFLNQKPRFPTTRIYVNAE